MQRAFPHHVVLHRNAVAVGTLTWRQIFVLFTRLIAGKGQTCSYVYDRMIRYRCNSSSDGRQWVAKSLQWSHNENDGVPSHQPLVYSGTDQKTHQSSVSLAFVRGIHRRPLNSPHKGPVTRKMFPFDDVIMCFLQSGNKLQQSGGVWTIFG